MSITIGSFTLVMSSEVETSREFALSYAAGFLDFAGNDGAK
jgi:hypothetical protein